MKKLAALCLALCLFVLAGCSSSAKSGKHEIPYPEELETLGDEDGADAFGGALDNSDSQYFISNDYYNMKSGGTLHLLSHFETYQQTTEYTCAPAAACMVLHYYGIDTYNEMEIASMAGSVEHIGTSPEQLCAFFDAIGMTYEAHTSAEILFNDKEAAEEYIVKRIDAGEPVLVDWEDFGGHWQVIIGIDTCSPESPEDDVMILADPYDISDHCQDGYYTFPFGRFFEMWREGSCCGKEIPDEQPFIVLKRQ